jgi:hypothetical protein
MSPINFWVVAHQQVAIVVVIFNHWQESFCIDMDLLHLLILIPND